MSDDVDHIEATPEDRTDLSRTDNPDPLAKPGPTQDSGAADNSVQDPASLAELLSLWGELLGSPEIDPEAGFLAQGGESVTAMRVVNRVRARFGVRLPLPLLLSGSTARDIAAHIDSETAKNEVSRP